MTITRREAALGAGALLMAGWLTRARSAPRDRVRPDLYRCDGCEAVRERAPATIPSRTLLAPWNEPGERLLLAGTVFRHDGDTPAPGVVIYAYQTNTAGLYAGGVGESPWSRRHGRLRGWVKTDADGRYAFDTIKPGPYPDRSMPAHIHLFVGEPGRRPYYIDDVVFADSFGVTPAYLARQELRGGKGVVTLVRPNGTWLATRDIVLELHPR